MGALRLNRLVILVIRCLSDQFCALATLTFPGCRCGRLAGESHLKLVAIRSQVSDDETVSEDNAVLGFEGLRADLHATQRAVCHNCLLNVVKKRIHCIGCVKWKGAGPLQPAIR